MQCVILVEYEEEVIRFSPAGNGVCMVLIFLVELGGGYFVSAIFIFIQEVR